MRVCYRLSDNRIIESQSGGDEDGLAVLVANAAAAGYAANEISVVVVPDDEFAIQMQAQIDADLAPQRNRATTFRDDPSRADLIQRLQNATPQQIDTWVDNNITSIAAARALFKAILKVLALDSRN
jgi:hypothetical protein